MLYSAEARNRCTKVNLKVIRVVPKFMAKLLQFLFKAYLLKKAYAVIMTYDLPVRPGGSPNGCPDGRSELRPAAAAAAAGTGQSPALFSHPWTSSSQTQQTTELM